MDLVRNLIGKSGIDAVLISSVPTITYLTGYAGFSIEEREAFLFVTHYKQYVLTDGRYAEAVKKYMPDFDLLEISSSRTFKQAFSFLSKSNKIRKLGLEEKDITVTEYKMLSSCFNVLKHFSLDTLRSVKDQKEITSIQHACTLGDRTYTFILHTLKSGVSEKEIACEIEFYIKKNNADISFRPIVAFAENSSIPHHMPTDKKLTKNSIVLLDFGAKIDNYCSDITRTVFFGSANAEFKKMYQTVLETQSKVIESLIQKCQGKDVDKIAREYIIKNGYLSIPHSLGHGVGIEVHEAPRLSPQSNDMLQPGMVFSIEPGIYVPGFGGVRIEDLVVLQKSGPRLLTKTPKELIEL